MTQTKKRPPKESRGAATHIDESNTSSLLQLADHRRTLAAAFLLLIAGATW